MVLLLALTPVLHGVVPALAQDQTGVGPSSGLPLPRFASVRNAQTNVRVGPGTRYNVAWVFLRAGIPVEIVQEFDTWRKIRDVEGAEGWLHQSLVAGARAGIITPWASEGQVALRVSADPGSGVRAWLTPNLIVSIRRCTGVVCDVRISHAGAEGRSVDYAGFVEQSALWGVYPGEVF
nr:SH3 domain-containing protein [Pelagibacterium limicola]